MNVIAGLLWTAFGLSVFAVLATTGSTGQEPVALDLPVLLIAVGLVLQARDRWWPYQEKPAPGPLGPEPQDSGTEESPGAVPAN